MTLLSSFNSHDEMLSGPVLFLDFINLIVNLISFVSVGVRNRLCVILLVFKYCLYVLFGDGICLDRLGPTSVK